MELGINKVVKDGNGNAIIYTALIAACVANFLPTVADGYYFYKQREWKQQLEEKKITIDQYWIYDAAGYYTITAGWYFSLLLLMVALGKSDYSTKSKILLALIGGGFVVGVLAKNIQKDKESEAKQSN